MLNSTYIIFQIFHNPPKTRVDTSRQYLPGYPYGNGERKSQIYMLLLDFISDFILRFLQKVFETSITVIFIFRFLQKVFETSITVIFPEVGSQGNQLKRSLKTLRLCNSNKKHSEKE